MTILGAVGWMIWSVFALLAAHTAWTLRRLNNAINAECLNLINELGDLSPEERKPMLDEFDGHKVGLPAREVVAVMLSSFLLLLFLAARWNKLHLLWAGPLIFPCTLILLKLPILRYVTRSLSQWFILFLTADRWTFPIVGTGVIAGIFASWLVAATCIGFSVPEAISEWLGFAALLISIALSAIWADGEKVRRFQRLVKARAKPAIARPPR